MSPVNPSTAGARVVVDELVRCGVTDLVLAPGSRSAPLAIAAAEAEQRGDLVLHVRPDERSAGYVAIGLAKVTGIPAAVITTSGTAAANLLPAMVEADEAGVPMLALTADRPPALRGVGANQAIDQVRIFGTSARLAVDMAVPARELGAVRVWRSTIARAVATATDPGNPGPVHVNIPYTEPLVPDGDDEWVEPLDGRPNGRPWTADARITAGVSNPFDDILSEIVDIPSVPARGLVIVGDHDDADAIELIDDLADTMGWPVISEPSGNATGCATALAHGALLAGDADFVSAHQPELVVTIGRVGLSRAIARLIASAPLHIAIDIRAQWSDPARSADVVLAAVPLPPGAAEADEAWLEAWESADVLAAAAIETALATTDALFTGMHVARTAAACVPDGGLLFVGPSWPVRHVYLFAATEPEGAIVLGNRGTSGIDGCISSAWGAAVAVQRAGGGPAVALVGDLTFLYDSNGLLVPEDEPRPDLVIVVADNNGGGIFSQLEQGTDDHAHVFERVFGTPLSTDIAALAESLGVSSAVVDTDAALAVAIDESLQVGGVHVIVAKTCDRSTEAQLLRSVQHAVSEANGGREQA